MSTATINEDSLYDIGDALRETIDTTDTYLPSEMGPAIRNNLGSNVRYTEQSPTDAQKQQARANIGAVSDSELTNVVRYTAQSKTTAEKTQARANIGAVSDAELTDVVRYTSQSKTTAQKAQARTNIGAQETLTFDNSPTSGSSNPVKSSGIYTALQGKQNTLTFDNTPTSGSSNPVKSGGIKTAIDAALASVATADAGKGVMLKQKNTIAAPVPEFTLYGKAMQDIVPSPNLAKPTATASNTDNGVDYTYNAATNTITASGTAANVGSNSSTAFLEFDLPSGSYAVKDMLGNTSTGVEMLVYNVTRSLVIIRPQSEGTFTLTAANKIRIRMHVDGGVTVTNKSMQIMLVAGTTMPQTFQPYGNGMPAPDSPVPISIAGSAGSVGVVCAGKNLLDVAGFTQDAGSSIDRVDAQSGTIVVVSSGGTYSGASNHSITLLPGVRYVCSGNVAGADGGTSRIAVRNAANVIKAGNTTGATGAFAFTFMPTEPGWYVTAFASLNTAATGSVTYTGLQIEMATAATDFAPYNGIASAIPTPNGLPGIPVTSGGNYTDKDGQKWICDTIDKAAGVYTQRVGVATLTDSMNWQKGASFYLDGNAYYAAFPNAMLNSPGFSNMFIIDVNGGSADGTARFAWNGHQFLCYTSAAADVSAWKAILASTPMTVIYALATPVTTPLTAAQITALNALQSHEGMTVVYTTDAMQPEIAGAMCSDLAARIAALEDCIEVICYAHNDLVDGSGYHIDYVDGEIVTEVEPNG